MDILGKETLTINDAKEWAKAKGATSTFIDIAPLFWTEGRKVGVRPEVAYAQSGHETGFGRFGGVLDESFHNPAGLKNASGGDNQDPMAHHRFKTWQLGIRAQVHHLALYAGAEGFPRKRTPDPRHFPSLFGKAKTVEALSEHWAGPGYGDRVKAVIVSLLESGQATTPGKKPPFVSRAGWGAAPPKHRVELVPTEVEGIFVHYTASDSDEQSDHRNCARRVQGIQAFHMGPSRGWSDIAYSFVVCKHGVVFEGRGWGIAGAHTLGFNNTNHAVCFLGNDTTGRDDVTDAGRSAIGWVIREGMRRYRFAKKVRPHSAVNPTSCPGDELRAYISKKGWKL